MYKTLSGSLRTTQIRVVLRHANFPFLMNWTNSFNNLCVQTVTFKNLTFLIIFFLLPVVLYSYLPLMAPLVTITISYAPSPLPSTFHPLCQFDQTQSSNFFTGSPGDCCFHFSDSDCATSVIETAFRVRSMSFTLSNLSLHIILGLTMSVYMLYKLGRAHSKLYSLQF